MSSYFLFCCVLHGRKISSEMSHSSDPTPFENYFVVFQLHKGKDESKNMDVFLMRIMKVERQVEALEEE